MPARPSSRFTTRAVSVMRVEGPYVTPDPISPVPLRQSMSAVSSLAVSCPMTSTTGGTLLLPSRLEKESELRPD